MGGVGCNEGSRTWSDVPKSGHEKSVMKPPGVGTLVEPKE